MVDACPTTATAGYTAAYEPVVATSLAEAYESLLIEGDDAEFIFSENSVDCTLYAGKMMRHVSSSLSHFSLFFFLDCAFIDFSKKNK